MREALSSEENNLESWLSATGRFTEINGFKAPS